MSFNELASIRPYFTKTIHREVYPAIDSTKPELSLAGKTVLVTGAGRGIGLSITEAFAQAKAKTIILTGRSESSLVNAKTSFEVSFPTVEFVTATVDIGSPESVDALFDGLKGKVNQIDVLVNNAGVFNEYGSKIGDTDVNKFLADMNANANGPYLLARGLLRFNKPDATTTTTYITLTTGVTEPFTLNAAYMLSKLPAVKLVQILNDEYPNVRSFAVIPGLVPTDMFIEAFRSMALDKASLVAGLSVFLAASSDADALSGRFLDARWDIEEVLAKKEEIVSKDLLKLRIDGY
ncbi:hypothetical protein FRC14_008145 [Serendipita sp. 396]|nr:hypothetical protein FRC14_008145 [Serendipita sp. 396]KAG8776800.1 hypothetical protein FRC16_004388 [Serendipita sp. 398]KAG8852743.1 hypothetical protein FRC20_001453 [Serendipita sp. 405]